VDELGNHTALPLAGLTRNGHIATRHQLLGDARADVGQLVHPPNEDTARVLCGLQFLVQPAHAEEPTGILEGVFVLKVAGTEDGFDTPEEEVEHPKGAAQQLYQSCDQRRQVPPSQGSGLV
jgi:hypothetical protein